MNVTQTPGATPGRGFFLQVCINACLLGVAAMVTQAVLAREALSTAAGHELMLGVALCGWLLGQVVCLALVWKLGARTSATVGLSIAALLAPVSFFAIRIAANTITPVDGTLPSLLDIAPWVLVCLLPASLGFALAFAAIYHRAKDCMGGNAMVVVYGAETLGFLLGGVLWTFAFAGNVSHLVTMLVVAIGLVSIQAVLAGRKALLYAMAASGMAVAAIVYYPWLGGVLQPELPDGVVQVRQLDGKHARWQVGEYAGEYSFYRDGRLYASTGQPSVAGESVLLPLSQLPSECTSPRILVIGSRYPGVELELGSDLLGNMWWLENDEQYGTLYSEYVEDSGSANVVTGSAGSWVARGPWDMIVINTGAPSGTGVAWAYSPGFLQLCSSNLTSRGLLALSLDAEGNYNSPALLAVHNVVRSNLESAFEQVVVSPPIPVWYFAGSDAAGFTIDAAELAGRLELRGISVPYMHRYILEDRLAEERAKAWGAEGDDDPTHVSLSLAGLRAELLGDDRRISSALGWLAANSLPVGLFLCGLLLVPLVFATCYRKVQTAKKPLSPQYRALATAFWCGFSCLGVEVVLAWELQKLTGSLYLYLALLTAVVLCGLFIGITSTSILQRFPIARRWLISKLPYVFLATLVALMPHVLDWVGYITGITLIWLSAIVIPLGIGTVLGQVLAEEDNHPGMVYGMDMLGAALAALLVGSIGMLVWGSVWCSGIIAAGWAVLWLMQGQERWASKLRVFL